MRPAARVIIGGRDVSATLFGEGGPLISLTVTDEAGLLADCLELELDNRENFSAPKKGMEIQVWLGYEPTPVYMGKYTVDEVRKTFPERVITVSAKAAELTGEIRSARSRSHHDTTIGAVVKKAAEAHGLTAVVDSRLASVKVAHIDQQNESDLAFLSRLAKRNGATFKVADGKAIFAKKGSSKLPNGGAKPAVELTPDMIGRADHIDQGRGNYRSVRCFYQDHGAGRRTGVATGSARPQHRDRRTYATREEALNAAKAQMGDLARGKKCFSTEGPGLPSVFAEAKVTVSGFDADVDGEYMVKSVSHTFTVGGFTTSTKLEIQGESDDD